MPDPNPQSTAKIAGHPIHPMLIPFPVAFFVGALAVDIAYAQTGEAFWATAGRWLLGAGLVMAALAALTGLTDFLGDRRIRALRAAWYHMIGNVIVVLIELFSLWQRIELGAAFVVPTGLTLSVVATLLLLFNGWKGWDMVYRHHVAIIGDPDDRRI
jgi:uncharacterized membrane protein